MTDTNCVVVCGRLTEGITEKNFGYVGNGVARLSLSLAVNRSYKQNEQWVEETSFFEAQIWGKFAESLKEKVEKGKQVIVSGELRQDRWKDNNGNNKSRIYIVANSVQFVGGKNQQDNAEEENPFGN